MTHRRKSLIALLITGLIASGCHTPATTTVAEYRPRMQQLNEAKAPAEGVFELVRWTPIAPVHSPSTQPLATIKPAPQMPVEVEQVYVRRNQPLGFSRHGGQLVAFADQTAKPLVEAHYEWRTMPGQSVKNEGNGHLQFQQVQAFVATIVVVAIVGGLVFLYYHDNRHQPLDGALGNGSHNNGAQDN